MSTLVIARLTFREAARRRILWAALLLGILFLVIFGLGFSEIKGEIGKNISPSQPQELIMVKTTYNFMLMAGLYVVNFLCVMMAVLTSVDTISGEISTGTVHTLVSKPLHRWEIVFGKWLGFAGMLSLYLLLMAGGVMAVVYGVSGYLPPHPLQGILLIWINTMLLLGVSLAGGAVFSTLANGVLVFGLYGVAFIGGWIEQIGSFLNNRNAVNIGIISSLIIPTEALWKRAAYEMQSPVAGLFGNMTPFTSTSVPSPMMVGYGLLYALGALGIAIFLFGKRDL